MRTSWLLLLGCLAACGGAEAPEETTPPPAVVTEGDSTPPPAEPGEAPTQATPSAAATTVESGDVAPPTDLVREAYSYSFTRASRDPFRPMISVAVEEGPELLDLRLVSIIFNRADPGQSLATFRDVGNKKQFYVRQGQRIGRLVVASIEPTQATLRVNDFGTTREHTYSLDRAEDGTP